MLRTVDWWDADESNDVACTEVFAALELRRFLALRTGRPESEILLRDERRLPKRGTIFRLQTGPEPGRGPRANAPRPAETLSPESFRIRVHAAGARTEITVHGAGRAGTLYGCYALLEKLGVRFLALGPDGTIADAASDPLPEIADWEESPAFETRGFWAWEPRGNREFFLWMARNRLNFWTAAESDVSLLKLLGFRLSGGGHDVQSRFLAPDARYPYRVPGVESTAALPPDPHATPPLAPADRNGDGVLTRAEARPEWYGLLGGRRQPTYEGDRGVNFCTSNADARAELRAHLLASLASDDRFVDDFMFWMVDDGPWCECGPCRAFGSPTDRILRLAAEVARDLDAAGRAARRPQPVRVHVAAFLETLPPPTAAVAAEAPNLVVTFFPIDRCYAHALDDPECAEINQDFLRQLRGWCADPDRVYRGPVEIGEYYNVDTFKCLPAVWAETMRRDVRAAHSLGIRDFHYMHVMTEDLGPWAWNHRAYARLLWDPATDLESERDGFFLGLYPKTAGKMRDVHRNLAVGLANLKVLKHRVRAGGQIFRMRKQLEAGASPAVAGHVFFRREARSLQRVPALEESYAALETALRRADEALGLDLDRAERARVVEVRAAVAYGYLTFDLIYEAIRENVARRAGHAPSARAAYDRMRETADRLEAMKDVARFSSRHANATDGLEASGLSDLLAALQDLYEPGDAASAATQGSEDPAP